MVTNTARQHIKELLSGCSERTSTKFAAWSILIVLISMVGLHAFWSTGILSVEVHHVMPDTSSALTGLVLQGNASFNCICPEVSDMDCPPKPIPREWCGAKSEESSVMLNDEGKAFYTFRMSPSPSRLSQEVLRSLTQSIVAPAISDDIAMHEFRINTTVTRIISPDNWLLRYSYRPR